MSFASRDLGSVATAVLLIAVTGCRKTSARAGVERFETPEWAQPGGLELRTDAAGAALLLRHRSATTVYRYDATSATFETADADAWQHAGGEIVDCDIAAAARTDPFVLDAREGAVRWRERQVSLAGRTPLALAAAPDGERVAVLSATGSLRGSVAPALGRAGSGGQHFHQVFRRLDGTEQGRATALPLTSEAVALAGCWSADGRYMVYADVLYNHLCIIEADASGGDVR